MRGKRGKRGVSILAVALSLSLLAVAGCEDFAKHTAQVRQPAPTPQASLDAAKVGALPFPAHVPDLQALVPGSSPAADLLLAQAQASFDAGEQAYQAGQLAVAREDFNSALDRLMKSGPEDAGADTTDESQTVTPPESTAPIEEIANMESLPATDPRLAAMAEKELITVPHDIPLTVNASVLQYLSFFETPRGREIVELGLQRAGRYRAMIESTLKKEGVPQDLIYLAQAESAFKPKVISSAGARGIWQFMPYTGEEYGLDRNYWVDERNDPAGAPRAAAEHFRAAFPRSLPDVRRLVLGHGRLQFRPAERRSRR